MSYRLRALGYFAGIVIICAPHATAADVPLNDLDRRAAATLYSAYAEKLITPETITAEKLKGLTRHERDDSKKTALYSLDFGGVKDGVDTRGYMRITTNDTLSDPTRTGWIAIKQAAESEPEVFFKKVDSTADKYLLIAVRQKFGGTILAASQRGPVDANPVDAQKPLLQRFAKFVDFGKQDKLFGGSLKLTLMSGVSQPVLTAGEPLPLSLEDESTLTMPIEIEMNDPDGKAIQLTKLHIRLEGKLAPFCKIKIGEKSYDVSKTIELINPAPQTTVEVLLPAANSDEIRTQLYSGLGGSDGKNVPLVALRVGAQQ